MSLNPTQEILINTLVPLVYTCDRCGLTNVGYMDVHNDAWVGFYHFDKNPSGAVPDPELAAFRRRIIITNKKLTHVYTFDPVTKMDVEVGQPTIQDFDEERDEMTVCAKCMHTDPVFTASHTPPPPMRAFTPTTTMPATPGLPGRHRVRPATGGTNARV